MRVLITEAATPLGVAVREALANQHELRLVSSKEHQESGIEAVDLFDPAGAEKAISNIETVLYIQPGVAEPVPQSPEAEHELLDKIIRWAYNLYTAAAKGGVKKIVHVGSLEVMALWPKEYVVTEMWRPRPAANAKSLAFHLSEQISREVARESEMSVLCLRMTTLVREEEVIGQPFDPTWLDVRDAAVACRVALDLEPRWTRWTRAHIGPTHPFAVWPSMHSWSHYGEITWQPQHDFKAWWQSDSTEPNSALEEGATS